jgi:hypothetical protein
MSELRTLETPVHFSDKWFTCPACGWSDIQYGDDECCQCGLSLNWEQTNDKGKA